MRDLALFDLAIDSKLTECRSQVQLLEQAMVAGFTEEEEATIRRWRPVNEYSSDQSSSNPV